MRLNTAQQRITLGLVMLVTAGLFLLGATRLLAAPAAGVAPGCASGAAEAPAITASVVAALAQTPQLTADPRQVWRVQSVCQQDAWAYAFVKGYAAASNSPLSAPSLVALLRRGAAGWQAVLPPNASAYNQALADVPTTLVPAATKAMLSQPSPGVSSAPSSPAGAYFSGFALPWPAGLAAYVLKHWYPAIDFSIGDPGPGDTIRNAKAGTAVFVKGSSTVECGDPPPNWTCWMYANAVVIQSGPNEYAWYMHLVADSIPAWLQEGVAVPAGADIGQEGQTGWASVAHLHFMVSTSYACCDGSGDGRFPAWPNYATWPVDFNEYGWYDLPYQAVSQNGSPPPADPPPAAPPSVPTPQPASAPVPTDPPPAASPAAVGSACSNPYAVQPGDWLSHIATSCSVDIVEIVSANPGLNPNLIYAGQLLNMPAGLGGRPEAAPTDPAPRPAAPPAAGTCVGTHVVAAGETLYQIGLNCGLSWQKLAAANGLGYPYTIYTGQTLRYP